MKENTFNADSVTLNYVQGGNGDMPVLLLHGGSSRWQTFDSIIPELSKVYRVYAVDLRGHGKSGRTTGQYKIQDYVPDIKEFIEKLIQKPVILFGHSLGGMIAVLLAAYHPELVKAVIIGDSPISLEVLKQHSDGQKEMTMLWREWARTLTLQQIVEKLKAMQVQIPGQEGSTPASQAYGENHPWFRFMAENLKQNDPDMLTAIIDEFDTTYREYDVDRLFPMIKCPVFILKGEASQGSLIRDIDIDHAYRLIPNVKHEEIKGVGHALYMQDKEAVTHAIVKFIGNL